MKLNAFWVPILVFLFLCGLSGCGREIYAALQNNQQRRCQELPSSQYAECMEGLEESYDSYSRIRNEALDRE
jgi:hypothetical protein